MNISCFRIPVLQVCSQRTSRKLLHQALIALLLGLFGFPALAVAGVDITSVTAAPNSVAPGDSVDVTVNFTTSGGGAANDWESTNITLTLTGETPVVLFCGDSPNFTASTTANHTFTSLTVPPGTAAGEWTVRVRAFNANGACNGGVGGNDDEDISETLTVESEAECAIDADCDNGLFCDGSEVCNAGVCEAGTAPDPDDGVACTIDSCDEDADTIVNASDDSFCDNGLFCDGSETCHATDDCQAGTPPDTDDGVACTIDSCDEDADTIVNTPDDSFCDNGDFCDGSETCDAISDCQAGTPPVTDDGVSCTNDSCDEVNDVVVNTPDDANCDNGDFCDGSETCDAISDCQAGTPPDTDDGVGCTDDSCDEDNDVIVNTPNDLNCNQATSECSLADTCDPVNDCQFNNVECGSVTTSGLCEFDEEPGKDGDQFRVAFSPDMQNWVSYKQNSTNPGQFYYNAIYQAVDSDDGIFIAVPYPFVTQGATPLHVYDAAQVPSNGLGCLDPQDPLWSTSALITLDDWLNGTTSAELDCDQVVAGVDDYADKWCILEVDIPEEALIAAEGFMYVNLHLDYGLKGPHVDADDDGEADRYDRAGFISEWGSSDALFNTDDNTGDVAIADCSEHYFAHANFDLSDGNEDSVENLNVFKKAAGAFGHTECADNGDPLVGFIQLRRDDNDTVVYTTEIDVDGYYAAAYAHKGKPTFYYLAWCDDAACTTEFDRTASFGLQSNGFVQVDLLDLDVTATLCDGSEADLDDISPVYSSGKFKN